jgi:LytS/YehU family sensor histidine kinase
LPFVENALKHSYIEKSKMSFIDISLNGTKENIFFEIENSLPESIIQKDETGGIGLENVQKRLTILYAKKHDLSITKYAKTFKVTLTIKTAKNA